MKLVKFEDGTFGVMRRKFWGKPHFLSINAPGQWWEDTEYVNKYCKGTKAAAELAIKRESLRLEVVA